MVSVRKRGKREAPQEIVTASSPVLPLTTVIAAHGGAGATTLCRWLGYYAQDWGVSVPPEFDGGPVLVVARDTAHGTLRVTELVRYLLTDPSCGRIVIAVVGDGLGPEPAAARARLRALSPHVSLLVRVPYVARWRYEDDPLLRPAPAPYDRALKEIRAALEPTHDAPMPTRRQSWASTATS